MRRVPPCVSRERVQPRLPTVLSVKVIQSEESCFQWSRRQLITQFRGREPTTGCIVYGRKGSPLGLEIIVITVIKIHGLFALEREGKGGFSSSATLAERNAAIHSVGSREYNRPRRVIKCLHWLNGSLDSSSILHATAFFTTYFSCIYLFLYKFFFLFFLPRTQIILNNDILFRLRKALASFYACSNHELTDC